MDRFGRIAIVLACIFATSSYVHAQQATTPTLQLGPEAWFVILGVCVTIGINLEQLRRVRSDVREIKRDAAAERADMTSRMKGMENSLHYLKGHRRTGE